MPLAGCHTPVTTATVGLLHFRQTGVKEGLLENDPRVDQ
jgi:hypothetical protein